LSQLEILIWILISPNAKPTGNGNTLYLYVIFMGLNVKNTMNLTRLNTIEIWYDIAKSISKSIPSNLKPSKENLAYIASNILIAQTINH